MQGVLAKVAYGRESGKYGDYLKYKFGEFVFGTGIKFGQFKSDLNIYAVLPVRNFSLRENKNYKTSRKLSDTQKYMTDVSYTSGTIDMDFTYSGLELLLLSVFGHESFGSVVQDEVYTDSYNHTLEFEDDVSSNPWKFGNFRFGDIKFGERKVRRLFFYIKQKDYSYVFLSNLIRQFHITGKAGDPVQVQITVDGWKKEKLDTDISSTNLPTGRALFPDCSIYLSGKQVRASAFSLNIERSFSRRKKTQKELSEPRSNRYNVAFSISTREKIDVDETDVKLQIQKGKHLYNFYIPKAVKEPVNPSISANRFTFDYTFFAVKTDKPVITATVRNTLNKTFWEV